MVPFQNVPTDIRVPLFYGEVNNSVANSAVPIQRTLIIGQKTAAGNGVTDSVTRIASTADGINQAGPNSILAQLLDDYRLNDVAGEVYIGELHDDPTGAAAAGTITFTAVATAAGSYIVYIGGRRYSIAVTTTMQVADLATALAAAINHDRRCTATATSAAGVVTLTADHKGLLHNDFPIVEFWYGASAGEVAPAGLATTVVQFSGGTVNPSLVNMLANCGDVAFDFIICPYVDTTSLNTLQGFLSDVSGRWSWLYQLYGHVFSAYSGTLVNAENFGAARNNQHESIMPWHNAASPAWRLAAAYGGAAAASLRNNAAQPLQTVQVQGMMPPRKADRFQVTDRNVLLHSGMSTFTVGDDGTMALDNVITTYQLNAYSQADNSYLQIETMFTIMAVLRALRQVVTSQFGRCSLATDGTPLAPGGIVVTPSIIKAALIAQYRTLCLLGLCQDPDTFKSGLVVEINAQNGNRVDVLYDPVLMGQLRIFAVLFQFMNAG